MRKLVVWLRGWVLTWFIKMFEPDLYLDLVSAFDMLELEGGDCTCSPYTPDFDRYVQEHNITPEEAPAAFAAWLNEVSGWDGDVRQVEP